MEIEECPRAKNDPASPGLLGEAELRIAMNAGESNAENQKVEFFKWSHRSQPLGSSF
jgi:hypothetical protein